jgi:hypothetical protein
MRDHEIRDEPVLGEGNAGARRCLTVEHRIFVLVQVMVGPRMRPTRRGVNCPFNTRDRTVRTLGEKDDAVLPIARQVGGEMTKLARQILVDEEQLQQTLGVADGILFRAYYSVRLVNGALGIADLPLVSARQPQTNLGRLA